jgi:hypothetical protein
MVMIISTSYVEKYASISFIVRGKKSYRNHEDIQHLLSVPPASLFCGGVDALSLVHNPCWTPHQGSDGG